MVVQGIRPGFLVFREQVDVFAEHEQLPAAVVPAVVGAEHLVVLPHVGGVAEVGGGKVAAVFQAGGFHERGVHVHVHLVVEHEQVCLGVVGAVEALDYLSVLVTHGRAILENGYGVLGVVVQVAGAQRVVLLVFQLHQRAAELGHVLVHDILQGFAGEPCLVLDNAHVSHGIDDVGAHVPKGRVAEEVGLVVEKLGGAHHLAVVLAVLLQQLGALGTDEPHFAGIGRLGLQRQRRSCQGQQQRRNLMGEVFSHYFLLFQASRENSHSENSGSMTM